MVSKNYRYPVSTIYDVMIGHNAALVVPNKTGASVVLEEIVRVLVWNVREKSLLGSSLHSPDLDNGRHYCLIDTGQNLLVGRDNGVSVQGVDLQWPIAAGLDAGYVGIRYGDGACF
jgi:hypothetical protein